MKKGWIVGLLILAVVIAAGVVIKAGQDKKAGKTASVEYTAKPKGLEITAFGGYKLDKITLDGESVPLIRIPLVTWGGYAALIAANGGT